jgi:hypothetical protein
MIYWFDIATYTETRKFLEEELGWWVDPVPLMWPKPTAGIIPVLYVTPRHCYEAAFLCSRGDRKLISSNRNWEPGDPPRPNDREHQSEKNADVLFKFFSMVVDETTRVLDPTCGSGVAIRVAKKLKAAYALGLEKNEQFALLARAALERDE